MSLILQMVKITGLVIMLIIGIGTAGVIVKEFNDSMEGVIAITIFTITLCLIISLSGVLLF